MTDRKEQRDPQSSSLSRRQLSERGRRRLTKVVVLSIVVLLLLLSLIAQSGFNLKPFVAPDTTAETLLLYALTTLNFLAFITVLFVLMRHVLKLTQERRAGRLGSKFKARLVSYAIGLSLLPVLLLFFFAFGLLNRSIDRWFGEPARQIVDDAKAMEESYFKKEESELANIARAVTRALSLGARTDYESPEFERQLRQEMTEYRLALAQVVAPPNQVTVQSGDSQTLNEVRGRLGTIREQALQKTDPFTDRAAVESANMIYILAAVRLSDAESDRRLMIVAREFPPELTRRAANIDEQHENFHSLLGKIKRIKSIYILLLAAVALLLIFAASWLALHVARGITVPIQALAEATDRVAHGDYAQPVDVVAEDELVVLVNSFNQMSAQLEENRERLMNAAEDLRRTNQALDNRRR
ncbi:MAG TPA: HAMP domain-containing protein, partial [Blastocatellia bacterium]|nr:HAMP domain-containing protein [Blastocatellia bacterium]